jgi:hypothetical protein
VRASVHLLIGFATALALTVSAWHARAEANYDSYLLNFFIDEAPADTSSLKLPASARDVFIARVRVVGNTHWRGGRHEAAKLLLGAKVEIIDVLAGKTATGGRLNVAFGPRGGGKKYMYPHTPAQRSRTYFIVGFSNEDNELELVGFPVARDAHERWDGEVRAYERLRGQPGWVDR